MPNDQPLDILSINAVEQIRRFLNDDKSFFDTTFLESVANVIFSKSIGSNEIFRDMIRENIITFGALCLKYRNLEDKYSVLSELDVVDSGLIRTSIELSQEFLSQDKNYTSQAIYEKFKNVMGEPSNRMYLETDPDLYEKFKSYLVLKDTKVEDCNELQRCLETKLEVVDVIEQIENLSQFITKNANDCNSITEFTQNFIETIDTISSSLTSSSEINKEKMNMSDVITGEGFSTVIGNEQNKVKCGISILDALMGGGFDKGRIYMFGGQTGGGKSTVLLNIMYGMLKQTNGIFFTEYDIYSKNNNTNNSIEIMKKFVDNHISSYTGDKKKIFLYYTLENSKEETAKRLMCRMGLIPGTFWMLQQRDKNLSKLLSTKGYNFSIDELPADMDMELKQRIFNFAQMVNIVYDKNQIGEIEIVWRAPYTISSYDILMDCKKYQRKGYTIESVFIDYPDKMRSVDSTRNSGDQNWLELGKIIDNLKALANQIDAPVIAATQLNKEGNKASTSSKLGASAGSMQKEYNSDTQINMNFNSTDDIMSEYFKQFTEQQRKGNKEKQGMFNNLIMNNGSNFDTIKGSYDAVFKNTARSSDIIQMKIGIPTIQKITSYITKNRDSIAKLNFEMYVAYGMYLVSDFDDEVFNSAKYAVETYMLIANYMISKEFISAEAYTTCVENEKSFIAIYNDYAKQHGITNFMGPKALKVNDLCNPLLKNNFNMSNNNQSEIPKIQSLDDILKQTPTNWD